MSTSLDKNPLEAGAAVDFGEGRDARSQRRAQSRQVLAGSGPGAGQRRRRGLFVALRTQRAANIHSRIPRPGPRGWSGRGGGRVALVDAAPEFRGSNRQVCGFWPFAAGSGTPNIGVPLGLHAQHGTIFCADPVFWFMRRLIDNPSAFVLGRPGLGKSTLIRKLLVGLRAKGAIPLVLSDLRPDYTDVMGKDLLDGQVIRVGPQRDHINPLDLGPLSSRLDELPEEMVHADGSAGRFRDEMRADLDKRRANLVQGLCELTRGSQLADFELTLLTRALRLLDDESGSDEPVIADLRSLIQKRPPQLRGCARPGRRWPVRRPCAAVGGCADVVGVRRGVWRHVLRTDHAPGPVPPGQLRHVSRAR